MIVAFILIIVLMKSFIVINLYYAYFNSAM